MAEYQRLDEVCHINMGQSPDSKSYNQVGDGLPFFQGNADFGIMYPETRVWCSSPTKVVEPGTLLISVRAPIGALNFSKERSCIGRGLAGITPRQDVDLKYIYYCLKSQKEELDAKGTGSTFKAIAKNVLGETSVKIVSKTAQEQVVQILDRVSSMVDARKQQLAELDNLIKARFVELFGDPVSNDYGWNTAPLENVCKTIVDCPHSTPSYTNVDTGYMCIRTSIVKKNRIMWDEIEYIPEHEYNKRIQRKRPEKGDIVYTREGAILGIAAIIDRECNVALGQRSMLLSPDTTRCLPQFLCVAMNFDTFLRKALKGLSGSASPHINVGDIKAFTIIVPPIDLQNQFTAFAEQVNKSKVVVQKALVEAQTLFDSLMQEYFG